MDLIPAGLATLVLITGTLLAGTGKQSGDSTCTGLGFALVGLASSFLFITY